MDDVLRYALYEADMEKIFIGKNDACAPIAHSLLKEEHHHPATQH